MSAVLNPFYSNNGKKIKWNEASFERIFACFVFAASEDMNQSNGWPIRLLLLLLLLLLLVLVYFKFYLGKCTLGE